MRSANCVPGRSHCFYEVVDEDRGLVLVGAYRQTTGEQVCLTEAATLDEALVRLVAAIDVIDHELIMLGVAAR
jgi:hypothetical protein